LQLVCHRDYNNVARWQAQLIYWLAQFQVVTFHSAMAAKAAYPGRYLNPEKVEAQGSGGDKTVIVFINDRSNYNS
jgi:hypothetical protein